MSKQIIKSDNKHLNLPKRIEITAADRHQIYFRYNAFGKKLLKQKHTNQGISANNGNLFEKLSFDPCSVTPRFGEVTKPNPMVELIPPMKRRLERRRRNPNDWTFTNVPTSFLFDRGYTGHEHLEKFNLINMLSEAKSCSEAFTGYGRVYDPFVARFLSSDPFVQGTNYTQSFNRYSYYLNNPLKYTDPNGYEPSPSDFAGNVWMTSYQHHIGPGSGNHWSDQYRTENANTYFAWANLHYNNVSKTTYGDYAQSGGQFLLNGSDVITCTGMSSGFYSAFLNGDNTYMRNNLLGLSWDAGRGNTFGGVSFGDPPWAYGQGSESSQSPTINKTITEHIVYENGFTAKTYTKVVVKGDPHIAINLNKYGALESVSQSTPVGIIAIGVNYYTFGQGPLSVGFDTENYIVGISIPLGNSLIGGMTLSFDKTFTNEIIHDSIIFSPIIFPQLRLVPLR